MHRSVFHLRLKDFELQAERIMDASLRTRPVAIISSHRQDGTLVSVSGEAKKEGLFTGMKVSLARKMSHSAWLLPYNRSLYARLNSYIYTTLSSFTPIVEPSGFGQFYLDMSGMNHIYPQPRQAGSLIYRSIMDKTALSGVIGISANKLVSRISTAVVPEIVHEVLPGYEPRFLSPLDSPVLPTAQVSQVKKLIQFLFLNQVKHLQQIVKCPREARVLFGDYHPKLAQEAQGQDTSVVRPPKLKDHLLEQIVLPIDTNDEGTLQAVVKTLAEQVAFQLRRRHQIAKRVKLEVHYTDGFKNSKTGVFTAHDDISVVQECQKLFDRANYRRNRVRAVLIDATNFKPFAQQIVAFETIDTKNMVLSKALDSIRQKYGFNSVQSTNLLKIQANA